MRLQIPCPAKINLYLAVTGKRADGYHELISLVAPLALEDLLTVQVDESADGDHLSCAAEGVPTDQGNLVLRAAAAFRKRNNTLPPLHFLLEKRIPPGSGLGGGSSNAVAALQLMNQLADGVLTAEEIHASASETGSDCPLFLHASPVVIRGRGEVVEPVDAAAAAALSGKSLLVVRPHFGISTAWAYAALGRIGSFDQPAEASAALEKWLSNPRGLPPLYNRFEVPAFAKYPTYPVLNVRLREEELPRLSLSGSGSAAFCFCDAAQADAVGRIVKSSWGEDTLCVQTRLR